MLKKSFIAIVVMSLAVFSLAGCGGGDAEKDYIEVRGSDTMVNLGQQYAEAFMDANPGITVSVTGGGSGTGIAALINNTVDIANASRAMRQSERDQAAEQGVDVYEFVVGQDAISVIVNEENPIKEITMADLKKVFTGQITEWSELGWEDGGTITLYSRQSNSGTHVFFWELVMDSEDWADATMFMPGTSAIFEGVVADTNAIGYVGVAYVGDGVHALKVAEHEGAQYVDPLVRANVDSGAYPIARPLYIYTNGVPEGVVLDFLNFMLSADGVAVLESVGFYANTPAYDQQNADTFRDLGIE